MLFIVVLRRSSIGASARIQHQEIKNVPESFENLVDDGNECSIISFRILFDLIQFEACLLLGGGKGSGIVFR